MRPLAIARDPLRYPLDGALGTEANVRVLRVLVHDVDDPLTATEVAALSGVTRTGALKSLSRLVESGLLDSQGTARSRRYAARHGDPVVAALSALFDAESRFHSSLLRALRSAFDRMPEVDRAWISSSPGRLGEPLDLAVVVDARALPWAGEELRTRLGRLEQQFNLTVEVALFSAADAPQPEPDAEFIAGVAPPDARPTRQRPRTHEEADAESLRLSAAVADLIRTDPSLIKRALRHVDLLLQEPQGTAGTELLEWRNLLKTYSPERLGRLLVSESTRARRLRQSSPLLAALTADERSRLTTLLSEESR